jgi:hypothetical protein
MAWSVNMRWERNGKAFNVGSSKRKRERGCHCW